MTGLCWSSRTIMVPRMMQIFSITMETKLNEKDLDMLASWLMMLLSCGYCGWLGLPPKNEHDSCKSRADMGRPPLAKVYETCKELEEAGYAMQKAPDAGSMKGTDAQNFVSYLF